MILKDRIKNILIDEFSTMRQTNQVQVNAAQSQSQSQRVVSQSAQTTHSSRLAGSESPRKVRKLYDYSAIRSASPIQASIKQEIEIYLAADYEENVNIKSALY